MSPKAFPLPSVLTWHAFLDDTFGAPWGPQRTSIIPEPEVTLLTASMIACIHWMR